MKKYYSISLFMVVLLTFMFTREIFSTSLVEIEIKKSNVANIYYEVLYHNNRLNDEINFELLNDQNEVIFTASTHDSILFIENIPFGNYTLRPISNKYKNDFKIKIDSTYLNNHHILKPLNLEMIIKDKTPSTNDNLYMYMTLFIFSSILMNIFYKKNEGGEE